MSFLNKLFAKKPPQVIDETEAEKLHTEILQLEQQQATDPDNKGYQQQLLIKYTQAVSVFAQTQSYRDEVDVIFDKMNNLRNIARKNF